MSEWTLRTEGPEGKAVAVLTEYEAKAVMAQLDVLKRYSDAVYVKLAFAEKKVAELEQKVIELERLRVEHIESIKAITLGLDWQRQRADQRVEQCERLEAQLKEYREGSKPAGD